MEKRAEHEAYERRQTEDEDDRGDDEEEDEDEGEDEDEAPDEEPSDEEEGGDEEEAPPKKKKKPVKVKEPKKAKPRKKGQASRMKLVWKVFNNSNQPVASYEFRQREEAEEHAARLTADKKSTHFVQPVKEAIEEKKEA